MRAVAPYPEILGDSEDRIMARMGTCMGMNPTLAVWRFGSMPGSNIAKAFGVSLDEFLWVLATRKTGKIKDQWKGFAVKLPKKYRSVIEWEPNA